MISAVSYIREQLDLGNMEKVTGLLGEPYAIHGEVVHGNHIGGAVLGFPTANITPPPEKHLPVYGVYVSRVYVDGIYYGRNHKHWKEAYGGRGITCRCRNLYLLV